MRCNWQTPSIDFYAEQGHSEEPSILRRSKYCAVDVISAMPSFNGRFIYFFVCNGQESAFICMTMHVLIQKPGATAEKVLLLHSHLCLAAVSHLGLRWVISQVKRCLFLAMGCVWQKSTETCSQTQSQCAKQNRMAKKRPTLAVTSCQSLLPFPATSTFTDTDRWTNMSQEHSGTASPVCSQHPALNLYDKLNLNDAIIGNIEQMNKWTQFVSLHLQ